MILPTIHLNGSNGQSLANEYAEAAYALREAAATIPGPNGRDYYPQGAAAIDGALNEDRERRRRITAIADELDAIARHCISPQPAVQTP